MTAEEWRPIAGFPGYAVSNLGRVVSHRRGRPRDLRGGYTVSGYHTIGLWSGGRRRTRRVHQLVVEAFIGPRPPGSDVRHLDGDKTNNCVTNLAIGTRSENMQDLVRHGAHPQANKTHCPQGHPYDEVNTYVSPSGYRHCRPCARASKRAYRTRLAFRAASVKEVQISC